MPKTSEQKRKILELCRIFEERTDDEHGMTAAELIGALDECGVSAERKSLYGDIDALRDFGMDIVSVREAQRTEYRLVSRTFELAELKLLVDAVQASRFITPKKSDMLISKLSSLASRYEALSLRRQVYSSGRIKTMNESIYLSVDKLHSAIRMNKKVSFLYYELNTSKQKVFRHGGKLYRVSPFALAWEDENYYLVAYDTDAGKIKHYRVDKMERLSVVDEARDGSAQFERFDMGVYSNKTFGMYGGREETVTLRCLDRFAGAIVDRFGHDVLLRPFAEGFFDVSVRVFVSVHLYAWIFGFTPDITIVSPDSVKEEFVRTASETLSLYK